MLFNTLPRKVGSRPCKDGLPQRDHHIAMPIDWYQPGVHADLRALGHRRDLRIALQGPDGHGTLGEPSNGILSVPNDVPVVRVHGC